MTECWCYITDTVPTTMRPQLLPDSDFHAHAGIHFDRQAGTCPVPVALSQDDHQTPNICHDNVALGARHHHR